MDGRLKLWTRLFKWFCKHEHFEELQGDLEERYLENLEANGRKMANRTYKKEIIKMMRPSVMKRLKVKLQLFSMSIFRMHLTLTIRNMKRHKVFSFVNVAGLAAAMTLCLFAVNMIYTGYQYDSQHTDANRIYRVITKVESAENTRSFATSSWALTQHLQQIPQIEAATFFLSNISGSFDVKGQTIRLRPYPVDEDFFKIFDFKVIEGNPLDLFNDYESIVITNKAAKRLFGEESPIGKQSNSGGIIRAVIESPDKISHLKFDMLYNRGLMGSKMSASERQRRFYQWENYQHDYFNYFKLAKNASIAEVELQLERLSELMNEQIADTKTYQMEVQQLGDIMFGKSLLNDPQTVQPKSTLITLTLAIVVLIALAGFNYTNLSIARSLQRSKEIGIRKITGSSKQQVISQFLTETTIFSFIALVLALLCYRMMLPSFQGYVKEFSALFSPQLNIDMVLWFALFSFIVGLVAGIFPALHFAKISPLSAINSKLKNNLLSLPNLKKLLVGFQVCLSTFSILFIVSIAHQKQQILTADLGFRTEGLMAIPINKVDLNLLTAELDNIPEIKSYTASSMVPGTGRMSRRFMVSENLKDTFSTRYGVADASFQEVYQPRLTLGKGFTKGVPNELIVDESFLKSINQPLESAIGVTVQIMHWDIKEELIIVGVLDEFAYSGLAGNTLPLAIRNQVDSLETKMVTLSLASDNIAGTLKKIEDGWNRSSIDQEFSPLYVDDVISKNYESFFGMMNLLELTGAMIILIAVLGQFGVALFNAESKVKEIGIRKVLGASFMSLAKLFSHNTLLTLFISALITVPAVYYILDQMIIPEFSMSLTISKATMALGLVGLWLAIISIVIMQTWKTANLNPAESLRNE